MPVNHKIQANVEIAGVKGKVTYVSSLKYNDVTLNPNLPEPHERAHADASNNDGIHLVSCK